MDDRCDEVKQQARARVSHLSMHAQSNADWVDEAIENALDEASDWPEIRVLLLKAAAYRAMHTNIDVPERIEDLRQAAVAHGMGAIQALAMVLHLEHQAAAGIGATSFEAISEARVMLEDLTEPPDDRVSGLIALSNLFGVLRLFVLEDDTLAAAIEVLDEQNNTEGRAVCMLNRSHAALNRAMDAAAAEQSTQALDSLDHHDAISSQIEWSAIPGSWANDVEVHRRLAGAVVHDEELSPHEVAELIAIGSDRCVATLLGLLTPAATWLDEPDFAGLDTASATTAHFLKARTLERNEIGTPATAAHREHAVTLANEGWTTRQHACEALAARIQVRRRDLEHQSLRGQVLTDPLTGARNRRAFEAELISRAGTPTTLVTIDLDDFKSVNDQHGHQTGDVVLQRTATALAAVIGFDLDGFADLDSSITMIARTGGDEFVVIIDGDDQDYARQQADALGLSVAQVDWSDLLGNRIQQISVGVAWGRCGPELLAQSDLEMYQRKKRLASRVPRGDRATFSR